MLVARAGILLAGARIAEVRRIFVLARANEEGDEYDEDFAHCFSVQFSKHQRVEDMKTEKPVSEYPH